MRGRLVIRLQAECRLQKSFRFTNSNARAVFFEVSLIQCAGGSLMAAKENEENCSHI